MNVNRRALLATSAWIMAARASANVLISNTPPPAGLIAPLAPDVRISYGQSDIPLEFPSFGSLGINSNVSLTPHVHVAPGSGLPGILPSSSGVIPPTGIDGIAGFAATDPVTAGRAAIVAQQLFRARDKTSFRPYIEFNAAVPGSDWTQGGLGGLGPGVKLTGSIVNDALTVTAVDPASIAAGGFVTQWAVITGPGVALNTVVTSPAAGLTGTYTTAVGQLAGAFAPQFWTTAHATFNGLIQGGGGPGNILTVLTVLSGTVTPGDTITGPQVVAGTVIASQTDGPAGGAGHYLLQIGSPQNVGSEVMVCTPYGGWPNMLTILAALQTFPVMGSKYANARFKSFMYLQASASRPGFSNPAGKLLDLTNMLADLDALNLPGAGTSGLFSYLGIQAVPPQFTVYDQGYLGTYLFCQQNAQGMGGPWSGRCFAVCPISQWPFDINNNPHFDARSAIRFGEWVGYVAHQVEDLGNTAWTPLWRPLTGGAFVVSGTTITIPFARPNSPDFTVAPMTWQSDPADGVKVWPQYGFHVRRAGVEMPLVSLPVISGMTVILDIGVPPLSGDEVSYMFYGPGGAIPQLASGTGGNLTMNGPPSVFFPGVTVDAWAWHFLENLA